jgi:Zinc knuckle
MKPSPPQQTKPQYSFNSSEPAPRATTFPGQGQLMVLDRKCFTCGKPRHFAKQCRSGVQVRLEEQEEEEMRVMKAWFGNCFNCDKLGHWLAECKEPKRGFKI